MFTLSLQEKQSLRERLKKTKNTCQAWIHTHHREKEEFVLQAKKEEMQDYRQKRNKLIRRTASANMPIIVFIPFDGSDNDLEKQLEIYSRYYARCIDSTEASATIYYITTFPESSLPCSLGESRKSNREEGAPNAREIVTEEWNNLSKSLNDLGIERIILSGAFYEEPTPGKDRTLTGCVNELEQNLTRLGFKVFVSKIVSSHPDYY